jgi:dGTPase
MELDRPVHGWDRRLGKPKSSVSPDLRSEYERDVDRVTYSHYFRRLGEVTQVSSAHGRALRHNRMTHSLKVAQVGRRLAQYLLHDKDKNAQGIKAAGGLDHNVVTAAGYLHDFGHPPFGHIGETELNLIADEWKLPDGFEGNAQTLRIVLSLANHMHTNDSGQSEVAYGLDLTRAVLAACVKYPWARGGNPNKLDKWGYYAPEAEIYEEFIKPLLPNGKGITLEASIMDWADDITYAVHDLQDFYLDGVIPLHHLRHIERSPGNFEAVYSREFNDFWSYVAQKLGSTNDQSITDARHEFERYAYRFPAAHYGGSREEAARIGLLASQIITDASIATEVTKDGRLYVKPAMRFVVEALKEITWYYVIDNPDLVAVQLGQRSQIRQMFRMLFLWVEHAFALDEKDAITKVVKPLTQNEQWLRQRRLPPLLRAFTRQLLAANYGAGAYHSEQTLGPGGVEQNGRTKTLQRKKCYTRAIIDYIASMTEPEFARNFHHLCPSARSDENSLL